MGYVEKIEATERLLKAAHAVIGDRIDVRAEDPGWDAELHENRLLDAAQEYVKVHTDHPLG